MKSKYLILLLTIVLGVIIYFNRGLLDLFINYESNKRFESSEWLKNEEIRIQMLDNLIDSKILLGKSRTEVGQIIGSPSKIDTANHWVYDLGTKPHGLGIEFLWLKVSYKNDTVAVLNKFSITD